MKILRIASLPLLHRGDRLSNSPTIWLGAVALAIVGGLLAGHAIPLYVLSAIFLLGFGFWFSTRLTRELAIRALGAESCPRCGELVGLDMASAAFAGYTRACIQQSQEAKGAFSIDLGAPLDFVCPSCDAHVFFDYLDSGFVSALDKKAER